VMVEGQLELLPLAGKAEEVVRRLELAITDDRQLAPKLHPEHLVADPTPLRIGAPEHRVEVFRHDQDPSVETIFTTLARSLNLPGQLSHSVGNATLHPATACACRRARVTSGGPARSRLFGRARRGCACPCRR